MSLVGIDASFLPELCIRLPTGLQDLHRTTTTFMTQAVRILRSSDGFVYVFERQI
jgi:hypothetical protein